MSIHKLLALTLFLSPLTACSDTSIPPSLPHASPFIPNAYNATYGGTTTEPRRLPNVPARANGQCDEHLALEVDGAEPETIWAWTQTFDAHGNLHTTTHADGTTTKHVRTYDSAGRPRTERYEAGSAVVFIATSRYDDGGRIIEHMLEQPPTHTTTTRTFTYDHARRLARTVWRSTRPHDPPETHFLRYNTDDHGRRVMSSYGTSGTPASFGAAGEDPRATLHLTFDHTGYPVRVYRPSVGPPQLLRHDARGNLLAVQEEGTTTYLQRFTYDDANRLQSGWSSGKEDDVRLEIKRDDAKRPVRATVTHADGTTLATLTLSGDGCERGRLSWMNVVIAAQNAQIEHALRERSRTTAP